ncbi:MAG: sugar ABC transporter substrate-binding protein [Spirochaetaceae bacterium]
MIKKNLLILMILSLSVFSSLVANGQKEKATEAESTKVEVTEIRVSWWTNEVRTAVTLETIAAYEALNPNVKIIPEYTGWGGYWDKLATQIASNDVPDVFQLVQERLTEYADGNIITPLNDYPMDFDKIDAAAIDAWSLDGKKYGLPLGLNGWAVLYNPDIFDQAGLDYPTPEWTWDDFEKMAQTIKEKTGLYGVSYTQLAQDFPLIIRSAGYSKYSDDGKSFGFTDYSFLTDYLSMYSRLHNSGALIEESFTVENFNNWPANPMSFGEAAMCFIPSNQATAIIDGLGKAIPFMTIPGTSDNKAQTLSAALGFSLAEGSKNREIAADFINYFATSPAALEMCKANRGVPATAEARKYMLGRGLDPVLAEAFKFVDIASPISTPLQWNPNPKEAEITELVNEVWSKVMFEVLTPEEGSVEIFTKGNEILSR